MEIYDYFRTKYYLCSATKIKEKETDENFFIKYHCKIFINIEDANKKKGEIESNINNNTIVDNKEYFLTKTYGPLFNRKIQVQNQYNKIKKDNL